MYARGATPLRPETAGWSRPAGAVVPSSPAVIPATCVPWKDAARSTGSFPGLPAPGPGNERATITFGVVYDVSPRGKPAGYGYPAGLKNGLVWSTQSSTTPILIPSPRAPVAACSTSAPMIEGLRSVRSVKRTLG